MALPLKTGADLYNQQLIRARLQNLGAQPNTADVGLGQVYFNTGTNTAASLRIGYCYETGSVPKFHHVANLEDINRLEELISALSGSSSESVASVLGRVITLEGYFSNGKAKDADLLDGHNSDYFATATTVNDLLEDYEAFKAVFSDNSDDYINTWTEVKAFLDGIKNTEDLNAILLGINTELGKKANKATTLAGYGITDGIKYVNGIDLANGVPHNEAGYGYNQYGWKANGPALSIGTDGYLMLFQVSTSDGQLYRRYVGGDYKGGWYKILDDNNYASVLDNTYLRKLGNEYYHWQLTSTSEDGSARFVIKNNSGLLLGLSGTAEAAMLTHYPTYATLSIGDEITFVSGKYNSARDVLHAGNYSNLVTDLNNNLNVPSITIGGIKLSVVEGQLQIEGDAYATGQLSSGGIGSEGSGSGASGIVILEDWEKYDDTLAQVLGAGLGVGLRDKIAALESKATNVSVAQTLTSGKEIGAITIDGVATKLFAPDDYISTSGGTITGGFGSFNIMRDGEKSSSIRFVNTSTALGAIGFNASSIPCIWDGSGTSERQLLHEGNYAATLDRAYLKLSGGTLSGALGITAGNVPGGAVGMWGTTEMFLKAAGAIKFYNTNDDSFSEILHKNNFNSYAPTLTGTGASGTWGIDISGSAAKLGGYSAGDYFRNLRFTIDNAEKLDAIDKSFNGVMQTSNYSPIDGIYSYGQLIQFADITGTTQIYIADWNNGIYVRNSWLAQTKGFEHDWKQLAYTTSNVASATKLQTARSLWGNSFDGTADINGDIHLAAGKGIVASNGYTVLTAPSYLLLGYAQSELGQTTYLDGNDIYLRYGKNHVPAMYINSSGNVTIGASDYAQQNCKLFVDGAINVGTYSALHRDVNNHLWVNYGGSAAEKNLILCGYNTSFYYGKGSDYKSAMFINSSGNVGIGTINPTHKLHVNGAASIGTSAPNNALMLDVRGKMRISPNCFNDGYSEFDDRGSRLFYVSESYGWANGTYVYKRDGTSLASFHMAGGANSFSKFTFRIGGTECLAINSSGTTISGDLKVTGNIIADGQVSSGGVAEAGTGGVGGSALDRLVFKIPANTTSFPCEHGLGTRDISVSIYENGNDFQQVLADVYLDSTNVARIVFGSATDVEHKVVIIG